MNKDIICAAVKTFVTKGLYHEAIKILEGFLELHGDSFLSFKLGILYYQASLYEKAYSRMSILCDEYQNDVYFTYFLGKSLIRLQQNHKALFWINRTLKLDQQHLHALSDLVYLYHQMGEYQKAITISHFILRKYRKNPSFISKELLLYTQETLFFLMLTCGYFKKAWELFDKKEIVLEIPYQSLKQWRGESSDNYLIFSSQEGVGDEIMYTLLLSDAQKFFKGIFFICDPRLFELFQFNYPKVTFIRNCDQVAIKQATLKSKYYANGHTLMRYSVPDFAFSGHNNFNCIVTKHQPFFKKNHDKKYIGISYRSSSLTAYNRMPPISFWESLFDRFPNVQFVNLQDNEKTPSNKSHFLMNHPRVLTLHEANLHDNFSFLALTIKNLDAVITIDNYLAHLASIIGGSVFLILSKAHDWRWFTSFTVNPWYPKTIIIKQEQYSQWTSVFNVLVTLLTVK